MLCQIHYHAKQYDNDGMCHNKTEWWKLHGNISRNGYGNAIIGRYGGCFEEGYVMGLWYRRNLLHGLNTSHKKLTYLLQNLQDIKNQALRACS